jgi:hypothetical protein
MLAATLLGVFFVPLFFVLVRRWLSGRRTVANGTAPPSTAPAGGEVH